MRIAVEIPLAELLADYERVCAQHRALVHSHSLDALSKRELEGRPFTLRYVLLHLIEETARHNGHIDIMREMADGVTGVSPTARDPGLRRRLRGEVLHPAQLEIRPAFRPPYSRSLGVVGRASPRLHSCLPSQRQVADLLPAVPFLQHVMSSPARRAGAPARVRPGHRGRLLRWH
jgi:Protein of unknown function (DUF664)